MYAPKTDPANRQNGLDTLKPNIIGLDRDEIGTILEDAGVEPRKIAMRREQLWHFVYVRGHRRFERMHTINNALRQQLAQSWTIDRPVLLDEQISKDGTVKWLIGVSQPGEASAQAIETVYIPGEDRGTLCVSSQVGCTLNCRFCHTGTQRLVRNLTAGEIVGQLLLARDRLGDFDGLEPSPGMIIPEGARPISNIVMMGMGEPLYNFDNVKTAIQIMSDGNGLSVSKRRITLSTAGVVPMIERCGREIGVNLAISLHATTDEVRTKIVPLNRKYPLKALMDACRDYPGLSNSNRITFEYVMLEGINDSPQDARALLRLIAGIPAKINLIPFNPWPGAPYRCSSEDAITRFAEIINRGGYASPVRTPRGTDILAACGQLKSASVKTPAARRKTAMVL